MCKGEYILLLEESYGKDLKRINSDENKTIFHIKNESGNGEVTVYELFKGIEVLYNDFHFKYYSSCQEKTNNIIEINYCKVGRFECEFEKDKCLYMSEGDLAINSLKNKKTSLSFFPLSHYHGITILLNLDVIDENKDLFKQFGIDINNIARCSKIEETIVIRANEKIEHIFSELYVVREDSLIPYLKIKIIEMLFFINRLDFFSSKEKRPYYTKKQVDTVKEIEKVIISNLCKHYTLEKLSKRFDMPLTLMKKCFKEVYGTSIYNYLKTYRMQVARKLLKEGKLNVTEVAIQIGYLNPSKFSTTFKNEYGMTPKEFQINVQMDRF